MIGLRELFLDPTWRDLVAQLLAAADRCSVRAAEATGRRVSPAQVAALVLNVGADLDAERRRKRCAREVVDLGVERRARGLSAPALGEGATPEIEIRSIRLQREAIEQVQRIAVALHGNQDEPALRGVLSAAFDRGVASLVREFGLEPPSDAAGATRP